MWPNQIDLRRVKPEELKALQREITIHRTLVHPNIVELIDSFEHQGKLYIFLESLRTNLFEYMQPRTFDEDTAVRFFREVVKAVAYIHARQLVHRDIKPENVLLDEQRRVKLCDFGFSAPIEAGEKRDTFCGTQQYLPPEIVLGHDQTNKVDIWCLGVLLFELIHKRVPFVNKNIQAYLDSVVKRNISFISKVSQPLKKLILACLEFEPAKRPTAQQILNDSAIQEGGVKAQTRASSVVTGDRSARQPAKGHGQSYIEPSLTQTVGPKIGGGQSRPVGVVNSDKNRQELTRINVPKDDWFTQETFKKKDNKVHVSESQSPVKGASGFHQASPQVNLNLNITRYTSQPNPQQASQTPQAPPSPIGSPTRLDSPVKINFYKNTNFGPENFQKQGSLTLNPVPITTKESFSNSPGANVFFPDGQATANLAKNSQSTANSTHSPQISDPKGEFRTPGLNILQSTPPKDMNAVFGPESPLQLQRRHTDRGINYSPNQQTRTNVVHTSPMKISVGPGMVLSNPTSARPISPSFTMMGSQGGSMTVTYVTRPSDPGQRSISPNRQVITQKQTVITRPMSAIAGHSQSPSPAYSRSPGRS